MNKLSPEQIALLRKPLPAEAIKPHPTKTYLSSIKAMYVVERLNEVFGLGGWFATNEVVKEEGKWVVVKTTFNAPEYGIVIPDIFGGNDNADLGDAYKGACTDALTKIGSYLYIGMDVYKGKKPGEQTVPDEGEKKLLVNLVYNSDLNEEERAAAFETIKACSDYVQYARIEHKLEARAKQPENPNQSDINKTVRKIAKQPV